MEVGAGRLDDDCDGEVWPTVILSKTKDLAKSGIGSLWAQILRHGLKHDNSNTTLSVIPAPVVSEDPSLFLFTSPSSLFTSFA
jgi:hypothetical protein